jgi:signal transduction histidine kinase
VLIGGISAASAMVIVEAVALSAMISTHLVLPITRGWLVDTRAADVGGVLVAVRRGAILGVLGLATLYLFAARSRGDLASAGVIAFAGAAQLAPALVGAVTWRRAHAQGAITGIAAGFAVWAYTLFAPELSPHLPALGLLPQPSFGLDPLVAAVTASLGLNIAGFVLGSLAAQPRMLAQLQAAAFVAAAAPPPQRRINRTAADLKTIVAKFIGEEGAARAFAAFEAEHDRTIRLAEPVDPALARGAELMLAGALGASSARAVLARTLSDNPRDADQIIRFLDEAAEAVQFNRELLQATLDNLTEGVSVVDADLRLVAWNAAYLQLFDLPARLVHAGRPIADIYRFNARSNEMGEGEFAGDDVEAMVERRLAGLRRRQRHAYERVRRNGRILRSSGAPMPGGGYVTSYTDVTDLRRTADALQAANEQLEARVEQRTRELAQAKSEAEAATESKTHFLAAASHDLLQPLHAARLFLGALADDLSQAPAPQRELVASADRAITAANGLLRALLNLSRLEAGGVTPAVTTVNVGPLLEDLRREFAPTAAERGLALVVASSDLAVASDHDLLRSMLQNLIANALRYTPRGKVLVGARRSGDQVRFEVWDTGRGMPEAGRERIFKEFERLDDTAGGEGAGLGLAIVERIARLLGCRIGVRSTVGRGSIFWIAAPRAAVSAATVPPTATADGSLGGLRVLCVDNEPEALAALAALLSRWGVEPVLAGSFAEARRLTGRFDAALIDQQLTDGEGLALIEALGTRLGRAALITASTSDTVTDAARRQGVPVIRKPARPAALRAFLNTARRPAEGVS